MLKEKETNTKRHFYIEEVILILLLVLSLLGTRTTDYSPVDGYGYWIIMVFVFALLAIAGAAIMQLIILLAHNLFAKPKFHASSNL